jgi:hypothetical protein
MHFDKVDEAVAAGDAMFLADRDGEACVRGCYRCLLSYFNQPDHELIDRASLQAKQLLVDLARGEVVLSTASTRWASSAGWEPAFKEAGLPPPDADTVSFADQKMSFAWRNHFVSACTAPLTEAARQIAETKGWTLFELPETSLAGVPDEMISMFKD